MHKMRHKAQKMLRGDKFNGRAKICLLYFLHIYQLHNVLKLAIV